MPKPACIHLFNDDKRWTVVHNDTAYEFEPNEHCRFCGTQLRALGGEEKYVPETALYIAVAYHADGLIALSKDGGSDPIIEINREGLIELGVARALKEAEDCLDHRL